MAEILPIGKLPVTNPGSIRKGDWGVARAPKPNLNTEHGISTAIPADRRPKININIQRELDRQMD